jgi:hypothetical protein
VGKTELESFSKEELIQLILVLQDEIEALKLKFEKNQKPPTSSKNSSQPPSRDQKGNLPSPTKASTWTTNGHEKHKSLANQISD